MNDSFTPEAHTEPRVYTIEEAAELLKVSTKTIRRAISEGRLRQVHVAPKTPRVTLEAIREFLDAAEAS